MKGLLIRQIPAGKPAAGTKVVRLHYSADPMMTPELVAKLKLKYPDKTIWDREMEIDPNARSGQKVFPEFDESIHFVQQFLPLSPHDWTVYLACDPHPRRAHAFVYLAVSRIGEMVIPWSWWPEDVNQEREQQGKSRLLIKDYAQSLRDIEDAKLFPASYLELMDQAGKNFNQDEQHNFFDGYADENITFRPAKKNREYAGYDLISKALVPTKVVLNDKEELRPTLTIMRGCGDNHKLVHQFKHLRFREFRGTVVDKDPPADPMDKDRHLIDCVSYILLHEPEFIDPWGRLTPFQPIYPAIGY